MALGLRKHEMVGEDETMSYSQMVSHANPRIFRLANTPSKSDYSSLFDRQPASADLSANRETPETARFEREFSPKLAPVMIPNNPDVFYMPSVQSIDSVAMEREINFADDRSKFNEIKHLQKECDKLEQILSGTLSRISAVQQRPVAESQPSTGRRTARQMSPEADKQYDFAKANLSASREWGSVKATNQESPRKRELSFGSREEQPPVATRYHLTNGFDNTAFKPSSDTGFGGLDSFLSRCKERQYKERASLDYSHWQKEVNQSFKDSREELNRQSIRQLYDSKPKEDRSGSLKQKRMDSGYVLLRGDVEQLRKQTRDHSPRIIHLHDYAELTEDLRKSKKDIKTNLGKSDSEEDLWRLMEEKNRVQSKVLRTKAKITTMDSAIERCKQLAFELSPHSLKSKY